MLLLATWKYGKLGLDQAILIPFSRSVGGLMGMPAYVHNLHCLVGSMDGYPRSGSVPEKAGKTESES